MTQLNNENKKFAGFWKRLASFKIEYLAMLSLATLFFDILNIEKYFNQWWILSLPLFIIFTINSIFYFWKRQSLGYFILGLYIKNKESDEKVENKVLINRFFTKYVLLVAGYIFISHILRIKSGGEIFLNYLIAILSPIILISLSIIFHKQKQAFYDKEFNLVVIDEKKVKPLWIFVIIFIFILVATLHIFTAFQEAMEIQRMKRGVTKEEILGKQGVKEKEQPTISQEEENNSNFIFMPIDEFSDKLDVTVQRMQGDGYSQKEIQGFVDRIKKEYIENTIHYTDFAKQIRLKYNSYYDISDLTLAKKIIAKYPSYVDKINFSKIDLSKYQEKEIRENNNKTSIWNFISIVSSKHLTALITFLMIYLIFSFIVLKRHIDLSFKQIFKNMWERLSKLKNIEYVKESLYKMNKNRLKIILGLVLAISSLVIYNSYINNSELEEKCILKIDYKVKYYEYNKKRFETKEDAMDYCILINEKYGE